MIIWSKYVVIFISAIFKFWLFQKIKNLLIWIQLTSKWKTSIFLLIWTIQIITTPNKIKDLTWITMKNTDPKDLWSNIIWDVLAPYVIKGIIFPKDITVVTQKAVAMSEGMKSLTIWRTQLIRIPLPLSVNVRQWRR